MGLRKQTLWSLLPLLTVTVVNLVSVPLFYRSLGAELYALWFYVLTLAGAFGFMDLGLGVSVGRYVTIALGRGDRVAVEEYWGTGNVLAIPLLAAMAAAYIVLGVEFGPDWFAVAAEQRPLLQWSFAIGGVGLFFSFYGQVWLVLAQAHLDFRFLALVRTSMSLLQVLPALYLAGQTRNPAILIAWSTFVGALQLLVFILHGRRHYRLGLGFRQARRQRAWEMASYTAKTFLSLLVNSFLGAIDRVVVGRIAPAVDFAHYTIAANAGGRLQGLSVAMMGPVFAHSNRALGETQPASLARVYDDMFAFAFPWYLLVAVWTAVWHPVLLRLWLGPELASGVQPVFAPVVAAFCLTAVSGISSAQLGSLNRIGTGLVFNLAAAGLLILGVFAGWHWAGLPGIAWGFLGSRIACVAQDVFVGRLVGAGGWLAPATWKKGAVQAGLAALFASSYGVVPASSLWLALPAGLHLVVVAGWLLWEPIKNRLFRPGPVLEGPAP